MRHYSASFHSIEEELEVFKERFNLMMSRDAKQDPFSKEETQERLWLQKVLNSFTEIEFRRYHENGLDFLLTPIITAGRI